MTAEVIYGVVFGKPKTEVTSLSAEPLKAGVIYTWQPSGFSDDVHIQPEAKLIPFSTDEYNEPPCA